jgi:microcystin-dependent protein
MADCFLGEIKMFGANWAPQGWALCNGALLSISEYDALFNLIGTTYGGDGQSTFQLPDLQSRIPLHRGPTYQLGETGGVEQVTLTTAQLPQHSHDFVASTAAGTFNDADSHVVAASPNIDLYFEDAPGATMNQSALKPYGGNQPHDNMQPFQAVNFIIAVEGVYPPPS